MAQAIKLGRRRTVSPQEEERRQIMDAMAQTKSQLNAAYAQFNTYSDPDLVESCVYEINALKSRYSYYVRQVKQLKEGPGTDIGADRPAAAREGAV